MRLGTCLLLLLVLWRSASRCVVRYALRVRFALFDGLALRASRLFSLSFSAPVRASRLSKTCRLRSKVVGCAGFYGSSSVKTVAQQGAAPDRLQLRSLRLCLAAVSALSAAGELVVGQRRAAWQKPQK